ncbi:hypothetical protein GALMADRAFT_251490 [Galerina marginata CBS 339.88]|uniref:PWWP domain-containing protein n=1 Tax=Galerina marginata (strain CBS 339.88) TaxID=685588 RepID=A0A067SUE6_GALM3|nr:hypothetical protein GALMADRAFT_251490 [Galerina marginata CBS 339.88]
MDGIMPLEVANADTNASGGQLDSDSRSDNVEGASMVKRRATAQRKYGKREKSSRVVSKVKEKAKANLPSASGNSIPLLQEFTLPSAAPVGVSASTLSRPRHIAKKAPSPPLLPLYSPTDLDDLSDLTSLSSSETCSTSADEVVFVNTISKPVVPRPKAPQASTSKPTKRGNEPARKAPSLGTYVWVLINPTTMVVYDQEEDQGGLWWPGKILSPKKADLPLKVKLFGKGRKSVQIHEPSDANVLSQNISLSNLRFDTPTFSPSRSVSLENLLASPKKKQKRDEDEVGRRWNEALLEMQVDAVPLPPGSDSDESELPLYVYQLPRKPLNGDSIISATKRGKRKREESADSLIDVDAVNVDKDEASVLEIPGELVLSKDKTLGEWYWPARIETYTPPGKAKSKGTYGVLWLDGSRGGVERPWFYVMTDPKFATCKLGKIESRVVEVVNDEEGDEDIHSRVNLLRRSPSPAPLDPPPSPDEFVNLSLREQFAYTKNVLHAILNDNYLPSKEKHDKFIKGGLHRHSVADQAWKRGSMDPKDVDQLQLFIREWCLRDGGVVKRDKFSPMPDTFHKEDEGEQHLSLALPMAEPSLSDIGHDDLGSMRFASPPLTDALVSSPPEMPPSSCPTSRVELGLSSVSDVDPVSDAEMSPPPSSFLALSVTETEPLATIVDDIDNDISELTNTENDQVVSGLPLKSRQQGCEDFELLNPVAKIDYCANVLLPEAIRQILLWRSGDRTSITLLSPNEEEILAEKGQTLLQEKDWVMDIMRVREAQIRKLKAKQERKAQQGRNASSSARPRRNVSTHNYQE